jgi:hypothetical protein
MCGWMWAGVRACSHSCDDDHDVVVVSVVGKGRGALFALHGDRQGWGLGLPLPLSSNPSVR